MNAGKDAVALAFYKTPQSKCRAMLNNLEFVLSKGKLPVTEVPGWKQPVRTCLQEGQITEAQFTAAMKSLGA